MSKRKRNLTLILGCVVITLALLLWGWDGFVGNTSCAIYGRVVDRSGTPIAGVQVRGTLWRVRWSTLPMPMASARRIDEHPITVTGVDGRFTLSGHGEFLGIDSFGASGWYLPDTERWPVEMGGYFVRGEMGLHRGGLAAPDADTPYVYVLFPESDESGRSRAWKYERRQEAKNREWLEKMQRETEQWQANRPRP